MDNLTICKKIAEIEGVEVVIGHEGTTYASTYTVVVNDRDPQQTKRYGREYNPLTDDALCFQLMKKYKVERIINNGTTYYYISGETPLYPVTKDCNDNKTICKVIIKAEGYSV